MSSQAADVLRRWLNDPVLFVRQAFEAEPDAWQAEALRAARDNPRVAMSACKGPGKSCVLAWVIWWFLLTHDNAQVMALSITSDNLKDNLWKELAMWQAKSAVLQAAFDLRAERIVSREKPKTWWCSARAFAQSADPEAQANTLAGFHAHHIMIILDEVGDYPPGVVVAAEGIFAVEGVDAHLIVAGNPETVKGPLYTITTRDRCRWHIIRITGDPDDIMRSPRISKQWAQEQIDLWGRDNPWVMVNVLGLFPPSGSSELISANDVVAAQERDASAIAYRSDARIWGLDPAYHGEDASCLARRQGIVAFRFHLWRGLDGPQLATEIAKALLEVEKVGELPDAIFVDMGGVGSSAFDHLKLLSWGHLIHGVDFGSAASDERFANKRAEMWWSMAQWLKKKPSTLPVDPEIINELTAPEYKYKIISKKTRFLLESKAEMRKRGVSSPNRADALALTFAEPVATKSQRVEIDLMGSGKALTQYDPFKRAALGRAEAAYNPRNQGGGKSLVYYDPLNRRQVY